MSQLQSAVEGSQQSTRHSWHSIRPILKVRPGPPASTWSVYEAAESLDSEKATAPLPIEAAQDSAPPAWSMLQRPVLDRCFIHENAELQTVPGLTSRA
ncbi:hypothetical protein HBI80_255650, partial [Parastagonospora nodorum]